VNTGAETPGQHPDGAGTGKRLFPKRRIGCFEAGCEADFLVLSADPSRASPPFANRAARESGDELQAP
jgi:hypothetical protein